MHRGGVEEAGRAVPVKIICQPLLRLPHATPRGEVSCRASCWVRHCGHGQPRRRLLAQPVEPHGALLAIRTPQRPQCVAPLQDLRFIVLLQGLHRPLRILLRLDTVRQHLRHPHCYRCPTLQLLTLSSLALRQGVAVANGMALDGCLHPPPHLQLAATRRGGGQVRGDHLLCLLYILRHSQ